MPRTSKNRRREEKKETNWGSFASLLLIGPIVSIIAAYVTLSSFTNGKLLPTNFNSYPFDKRAKGFTPNPFDMIMSFLDAKEKYKGVDKPIPKLFQLSNKSKSEYGYLDHVKDFAALVLNQSVMNKNKIQNEITNGLGDIVPDINNNDFATQAVYTMLFIFSPIILGTSLSLQSWITSINTTVVALSKYFSGLFNGYMMLDVLFAMLYFFITILYLIPYTFGKSLYDIYVEPLNPAILKSKGFIVSAIASVCLWGMIASGQALTGTEQTVGFVVSVVAFPMLYSILHFT